jgi:hypothetical protein
MVLPMLVPEIFCGDTRTVAAASRRHIARYMRGASWLDAGAMIDVQVAPGLVMVDGPSRLLGGANIRLYGPFREFHAKYVREGIAPKAGERAFSEALESAWSLLGLLSQACYVWLVESQRAQRFLDAMIARWDEIESVGPRYSGGRDTGQHLWDFPHLLKFVLARRGVPQSRLVEPLPAGGISALLSLSN